jgi:hypothetical protein
MKATRLILALALAAAATVPFVARAAADGSSEAAALPRNAGASIVVQNEQQKQRLEAQGFPQYND